MQVRKRGLMWLAGIVCLVFVAGLLAILPTLRTTFFRSNNLLLWLRGKADRAWAVPAGTICGSAPFQMPTTGYIGFLWGDSFRFFTRHQGLDIFAGTDPGVTPVYAAYAGYLTRKADWKSSIIIRIPQDPLLPNRQIWTYYTHMANPEGVSFISAQFPAGSAEVFVPAGTLLGYQGNYSGDPGNPVGVHLHFSIVQDDGSGGFRNELDIHNTIDPSPYLGMVLNGMLVRSAIPGCEPGTARQTRLEETP